MKEKVLGVTLVALAVLFVPAAGEVAIKGILSTGSYHVDIDTVMFRVDTVNYLFETAGWGGDSAVVDSFDFDPVPAWPISIKASAEVNGEPYLLSLVSPVEDSWYIFEELRPTEPKIKFVVIAGGVEELPGTGARPTLEVSPSVLTDRVFIRAANVPESGVGLEVLDALGNRVRSFPAGVLTASWAGKDDAGRALAEGVYFCRLVAGNYSTVRKVLLAR